MRTLSRDKVERILGSLKRHPEGTYVSEIARETGLTKSTVSFLVSRHMSDRVVVAKEGQGGIFKILKLRPRKRP